MSSTTALSGYLPNFLLELFRKNRACFIHRLPLDIHVDHIFVHLRVEDIVCLRRVNKAFFLLTHEPIIWKRFLERMNIPIPPLRPTFRYSLQATDFEVEQLVTRAISLDDNWRKTYPNITNTKLLLTHYRVLDMKLLPGGKFLVASVKDAADYRYFIMIFSLDHPRGHRALARVQTRAKAYNLQAKYMAYEGKQGIMITYSRRTFSDGGPTNINASDYSTRGDIDPPHPFVHEVMCLQISLETLDHLSHPDVAQRSDIIRLADNQPPPFTELAVLEADKQIDIMTLFELNGSPCLSVVQQPDELFIIDVMSNIMATLICNDHEAFQNEQYRIIATRVLPGQNDILIIRAIELPPEEGDVYLVEIYDLPLMTNGLQTSMDAKDRYIIQGKQIVNSHISDYGIPTTTGDQPKLYPGSGPPPPIALFFETTNPIGIIHHNLWPTHVDVPATATSGPTTTYYYSLQHAHWQSTHISQPHITRVIPGAYRALMYTVAEDDKRDTLSLINLRRYINPETRPRDYPKPIVDTQPFLRKARPKLPFNVYGSFQLSSGLKQAFSRGISAITWDEGIGRTCIAVENEEKIRIIDFAHMVHPDARFEQWKRNQSFLSNARPSQAH